jgi:proline iminopeptidase
VAPIPEAERGDMILAYHAQLNAVDDETRVRAAKAWAKWEYVHLWFAQIESVFG